MKSKRVSKKSYHVLGLMSGSSLDGLDIAFAKYTIEGEQVDCELIHGESVEFSKIWVNRLKHLPKQDAFSFAKTNTYFGHYMGEMVLDFIEKYNIEPDFIASHGHTIYHYPDRRVTVQIGDGGALAAITGLPVICDFRTHDIAINGEGTPLAPLADKYIFSGHDFYLNLGGIANISCDIDGRFIAFDIAPANQVMNSLAHKIGLPYDEDGKLAAQGKVLTDLLEQANDFSYFDLAYPKSLDNQWIRKNYTPLYFVHESSFEDKFRTAVEHLVLKIEQSILKIIEIEKLSKNQYSLLITGGGAFNTFFIQRLHEVFENNPSLNIKTTIPSSDDINFKEALLMGLMGVFRVENKVNCLSSVTGALVDTIGGAIYQGTKTQI